ncbi:MAG: hypothetical protein ACC642_07745, partial [Pseudomonadales bacterium]
MFRRYAKLIRMAIVVAGLLVLGACGEPLHNAATDAAEPGPRSEPDSVADLHAKRALDPGYLGAQEGVAPLLEGIGPVNFPISTSIPMTQAYFNQALTFAYGFNHAEAARSFREAARLDPDCGICWWGVALVHGPNINKVMDESDVAPAWEAVNKALAQRDGASKIEQALIDTVATRYSEDGADREALDAVYAGSMRALADEYPDNPHILAFYAESLMDLYPWSYWNDDGTPKEHTETLVATIEKAFELDPQHPGALHLYIHAMEQYTPEQAVLAADALGPLVPVAG